MQTARKLRERRLPTSAAEEVANIPRNQHRTLSVRRGDQDRPSVKAIGRCGAGEGRKNLETLGIADRT
jgi:hypothetical protein